MKKFHTNALTGLAISVSAVALLAGAPASAQDVCDENEELNDAGVCVPTADSVVDNDPLEEIEVDDVGAQGTQDGGAIIVTGSRARTDTYNNIQPLQILSTEASRDVGDFDATEILQRSEAAAGQQIDATFQGFVLNNGPGSQTLNLRGLGADRTLLLVNGRRLAPAGVEGAPTNPSINLIPTSLVARYDLLLDGASSVYGSDAVAGVGNIILRQDIDGFEVFASGNINEQGGGNDYTVSGAWGKTFDRGFFGIGAEYARRDGFVNGDRDFLSGCNTDYEIDTEGNIRRLDIATNASILAQSGGEVGTPIGECKVESIVQRIQPQATRVGFVYYDQTDYGLGVPGNSGIPGFSESFDALGNFPDRDGDGFRDVNFFELNGNAAEQDVDFISPQDLYNVMTYGEYNLGTDFNLTPFFEANYSRAEVTVRNGGTGQFFPWVPATNVFNPCNFRDNPDGIDCRAADNDFQRINPGQENFGALAPLSTGLLLATRPIVSVRGDRNNVETVQEQYRGVLGLRADLPFFGDSWTYESSVVYSRSEGSSIRRGIREDRLALALGIDPTADFDGDGVFDNTGDGIADDYISGTSNPLLDDGPCDVDSLANPGAAAPDLAQGCVPVNLFAPSLFSQTIGDFATQAERDYLFGERTFDTTYEQVVASTFITGDVFELPAGPVSVVLGGEYRYDSLDSRPDTVASNGLFWGFFADQGAEGDKYILEGFGELIVPVFDSEQFGALDVNAAGRVTKDEFYGTNFTYSLGAGWQPIPQILLKGTFGTSFRAPNLRENFLAGQSGFNNIFDPCAVPDAAFSEAQGGYIEANDRRDPNILANCRREGRDPTQVGINDTGINTNQFASAEITSGGSLFLDPETSESLTAGLAVTESWGAFDLSFNFNFYNIDVEGAIIEPSGQFIVNSCFANDNTDRSAFCDFITYSEDPAARLLITDVFAGFINVNREVVSGIDLNADFGYEFSVGGEVLDLGLNLRANHLIERSTTFINENLEEDFDEDAGEFGFPEWTGRAVFSAAYSDFAVTWQTRWIGETEQSVPGRDEFSDAFGYNEAGEFTGFFSDTCLGAGSRDDDGNLDGIVQGDGVYCKNVGFADDYFVHTLSLRYNFSDDIVLRAGVTNVFDENPPLIDTAEVFGISNTPIGNGYDLNGREFFGSVSIRF
ncbi:TonB-dependent receptor domain-containing protein [Aurantiacibacter aquimixticola]|uniref:TonB-dependent receptor n=1 Tax=Aurantiacibacter aquimixticola TaxID=1958945 RepID=A0A419RTF1_9SPHN|nr:TonB-dependent receptor [Aurantiacibacter aquimixticola]RJY09056.1 TonB-dependent receptor [Aurantiacibacter aquimixticola]